MTWNCHRPNYNSNTNLAFVFDALIDIFTQKMISIDRILNKIQTFIDLSRSPHRSNQFEQNLLELLNNEKTLFVLNEIVFLAAKVRYRNTRFIDVFLCRLKCRLLSTFLDVLFIHDFDSLVHLTLDPQNSTNNRISFIQKSSLTKIKYLQFQYMTEKQLETILNLILSLRQYQNLPSNVGNLIKNIEEHLQSCLKLINKLTRGSQDDKRPRSPSPSSQLSVKRISLTFQPSMNSSFNVLQD